MTGCDKYKRMWAQQCEKLNIYRKKWLLKKHRNSKTKDPGHFLLAGDSTCQIVLKKSHKWLAGWSRHLSHVRLKDTSTFQCLSNCHRQSHRCFSSQFFSPSESCLSLFSFTPSHFSFLFLMFTRLASSLPLNHICDCLVFPRTVLWYVTQCFVASSHSFLH